MELKSGYKQTDIGNIPEDWDCVPSSELAAFFGGNAFKGDAAVGHGVKWLKIANVGKQRVLWDAPSFLPATYVNDFESYVLQPGDVVMALTRPILDDELKIAKLSTADAPALLNQRVAKVIASSRADINFIYHVLQTKFFVASMKDAMAGSDPPNIGSRTLGGILVAVPRSLQEQRAIAAALSDVDALIAGLEKLIAKKRDLKQAAMQQLLTGQTRLPGFSGKWVVKRLGEICEISMGRTPSRLNPAFWGAGHVWLSIADLHGKVLSSSKEQITPLAASSMRVIPKGTLLMSFKLSIGRLCFAGCDLYTNEAICGFNNLLANSDYLYYALSRTDFSLYGKQAVKGYTLNKKSLALVEVALPSDEEQAAIANVLSAMDEEMAELERRFAKTNDLKQGMMQELLTGRTRLV